MAPILNPDAVNERANDLAASNLNGLKLVLVPLGPPAAANEAILEVHFHNALHVADVLAAANAALPVSAGQVFRIRGGHRVPAGSASGSVHSTAAAAGPTASSLTVRVSPIGDYSTYTLELGFDPNRIDPFFSTIPFKFRPGCFTNDCHPPDPGRPRPPAPVIDYLAKDYDSFRHTLIAAMMARVPGWQATSEADLDQVLIDLFAVAADELSDYQDRVMNEPYLALARTRLSLARHARLVDYHVHQGNQASTWLAVELEPGAPRQLATELVAWAGHPDAPADRVYFATRETRLKLAERTILEPVLNRLDLYSWSGAVPALQAGSTTADLVSAVPAAGQVEAERVRDRVNDGTLKVLLVEEKLNPKTGREAGRDPRKRQTLRLEPPAVALRDPLTGTWMTRVRWRDADALRFDFGFTTICKGVAVSGVSAFHGNLLKVHQGLPVVAEFREPGTLLPDDLPTERYRHFVRRERYGKSRGTLCRLPLLPLAFLPTAVGGEEEPRSTLYVTVTAPGAGTDPWDERIDLIHSDDGAEDGDHFVVEVDDAGTTLRFGNGENGRALPPDAIVRCEYQVGGGTPGNVGAGAVVWFDEAAAAIAGPPRITKVWNPFDVTDGVSQEPAEKVRRNAPEAYRARQLRAVTLADYADRAGEVPGVSRAVARYAWTGSWRTVRIVIDPVGTTTLSPELTDAVLTHLEAVRLIGEDLEVRPPRFVPVTVEVRLCLHPDYWPGDVAAVLDREFSDGYTPDGRPGFFHPDAWTFGQPLRRSQIAGRLHAVAGVEHIVSLTFRRFDAPTPGGPEPEQLDVAFDEIILVQNDPDHMERGSIRFELSGGRH